MFGTITNEFAFQKSMTISSSCVLIATEQCVNIPALWYYVTWYAHLVETQR